MKSCLEGCVYISIEMCAQSYTATIKSISMSVFYPRFTVCTKHQLDCIIKLGSNLTGKRQQLMMDLHS